MYNGGYIYNSSSNLNFLTASGIYNGTQINAVSCTASDLVFFTTSLASAAGNVASFANIVQDKVRTIKVA